MEIKQSLTQLYIITQWSFGVTCWEVFSGGKGPYAGMDPSALVKMLESDLRLEKPHNAACTEET